jgi:hypothetical protein
MLFSFSPHKFLGGPGTVFLVLIKIISNLVPDNPGGEEL